MKKPSFFAQIHNDAIHSIANEMQYHIGQGLAQAGRQIERYLNDARDDVLRQTGLKATAQKLATGSTVQDMKNNLIERLQNEGFMTVQYGQGKNAYQVSLDAYAQMVARSTTREAGNLARENQLIENGYDLVEMTTHYPTCEECAKFQGRVYSLTGKDKRFPAIFDTAFKSGYRNIHPNCRHVIVPWIEGLQTNDEIKEMISKSNKDFKDIRSDAERDLYSKGQALNRQIRQDKYQYERYKARLGEDAPKSFHAFRKMKKAGGEKWGILEAKYKGMGYYDKAKAKEPAITRAVTDVAKEVGMDIAGLEYRIKSKESYLRKIESKYNPSGTEYEVKDILRYTYTASGDELTDKTLKSIDNFTKKGYNTSEVKNYWLDDNNPYKGVNTVIRNTDGQAFEVQYHTPESFALKNGEMHKLYEEWRLLDKSNPKANVIQLEMKKLSDSMAPPKNIERVK